MCCYVVFLFFFFKQKTAYEMRISDWSSDVCSSDLIRDASLTLDGTHVDNQGSFQIDHANVRSQGSGFANAGVVTIADAGLLEEIGRASCRERVCQYV